MACVAIESATHCNIVPSSSSRRSPLALGSRRAIASHPLLDLRGWRRPNSRLQLSAFSSRERRAMAVQGLWGSNVEASMEKPTFVALEQIMGEADFDKVLAEAQERNQPIVIDWQAAWCRKCIYLKPKLEKLSAEYHPGIKFYFVDVNTVPQSLVKRAAVTKMPTIQLWRDGQMKGEVIGGHQAWLVLDEVRQMIKDKN